MFVDSDLNAWLYFTLKLKFVLVGEHDTSQREESITYKTTAKPYSYHKHWAYNLDRANGHLDYDVALLELVHPVAWDLYPHIRPVCLPGSQGRDYRGEVATLVGWGNNDVYYKVLENDFVKGFPTQSVSNTLQKLDVRYHCGSISG